ncbi:MAG: chromosomal replication initiator protein DnaA [Candidatus Omnitrophica bacterium]|nr:chromosomal replication initiator protein DnaA [Candidatus Omnitrophota bacterium]
MPSSWNDAVEALRGRLGNEIVARWIAPLKPQELSHAAVVLEAPDTYFRDWVVSHYHDAIQESLGGRELRIVAAATVAVPDTAAPPPSLNERSAPPEGAAHGLKYTFDRFVVGPSNRFAHAASLAVAESPARAYNPLFIYGGSGLGKTHLMQAIGHAVIQRSSAAKVFYLSSEQFTNELISAIQTRTTAKFRERYRTADAILIDDIQFIAGKESTQEEFFHTFNTLYDAHKQLVISSDRPPKEIPGLEQRLVSRFEWGLVTDIQPPDFETRMAILRKKAAESSVEVPNDMLDFMARQITSNIRELEGALMRVVAYSRFFSQPITLGVAQEVLRDMVREVGARITIDVIQRRVGEYFQLSIEELKSSRRQRSVLHPRQLAMYLCRRLTESSLPEIGRAFGGRDHSTVLHAVEKVEGEIAQDDHKKRTADYLVQLITTASPAAGK